MISTSGGQNVLTLAPITLELQAQFPHSFRSFARLDFVRLFAFSSSLGTHLCMELLFAALSPLLETFVNVDGSALMIIARTGMVTRLGFLAVVHAIAIKFAQSVAAVARKGSSMRQLRSTGKDVRLIAKTERYGRCTPCIGRRRHIVSLWRGGLSPLRRMGEQLAWCRRACPSDRRRR